MTTRALELLLLLLWLSEWLVHWTGELGVVGDALSWLWFAALVILAGRSLARTRVPAPLVVWAWMLAILGVAAFRTWWLSGTIPTPIFDPAEFEQFLRDFPGDRQAEFRELARIVEVMLPALVVGLASALVAIVEFAVVCFALAIGHGLRDVPARVAVLPRLAVAALQLPTLLLLPTIGVSLVSGVIAGLTVPAADLPPAGLAIQADLQAAVWPALGLGLVCWCLGAVHLGRLLALADGGRLNRLVLALFALLPGLVVLTGPGPVWSALLLIWVALQLVALGLARAPQRAPGRAPGP